jgi:uncharacterized protein (UPF0332 family)
MSKEALRYLQNAKEILKNAPVEDDIYTDIKPVREACGTAYLAVLKAIDDYLLDRGVGRKSLPRSVDSYREMLKKHLSVHDGKLMRSFERIYDELHIAGYYRGFLRGADTVKDAIKAAEVFIEKIGGGKKE